MKEKFGQENFDESPKIFNLSMFSPSKILCCTVLGVTMHGDVHMCFHMQIHCIHVCMHVCMCMYACMYDSRAVNSITSSWLNTLQEQALNGAR